MTQNNNSLLPDGYRFWSDDNEPLAQQKTVVDETDTSAGPNSDQPLLKPFTVQSQASLSETNTEPTSVEDSGSSTGDHSKNETAAEAEFQTERITEAPRQTGSVLAGLWLRSVQSNRKNEVGLVASEWTKHAPEHHGWSDNSKKQAPSAYWRCNNTGVVDWFLDQNGTAWSRNLSHDNLFCSDDGGERASVVRLTDEDLCVVEDSDGTILTISSDGKYSAENRRKSREQNVRSLMAVFGRVDTNGDDRLSISEIENALKSCNENDRPLIHSLKMHFNRIEWSRRGMFGQMAEGLSLREIFEFTNGGRISEHDIDETLLSQIETVIDFIAPHGVVHRDSLVRALRQLKMPARLRRSIEVLIMRLDELSFLSNYGYSARWQPTRQVIRVMLCDLYKQMSCEESVDMGSRVNLEGGGADQKLYADEANPLTSIVADAINNCHEANQCFMSVLTAAIVINPEVVLRSIRRSDNGAFVVTFWGDCDTPMRVLVPAQREIHEYGLASKYGVWALVLARAFAQYLEHRQKLNQPITSVHEVAELILGKKVECLPLKEQCTNELSKLIDRLWAKDQMMVLCRFPALDSDVSASRVLKHTSAVTGWDPQSGVITCKDPQSQLREQVSIDLLQTCFDSLLY